LNVCIFLNPFFTSKLIKKIILIIIIY